MFRYSMGCIVVPNGTTVKDFFQMEQKIFERLAEERERLGLNKSEMAIAGGIAKPTYLRYESGERSPDGAFFAQIAAAGADVLYILTGQRSQPVAPEATLPPRERALLDNYRHTDEAGKKIIEGTAGLAAQQQKKKAA